MELDKLREKIIVDINESKLPIDAIYFVLKDILGETISEYNRQKDNEKKCDIIEKEEI